MPGRGDGDGGVAKGHAKKRDLDDKLRVGLGAVNPDAKRRHTVGGHRQRDDGTSSSSSFQSSAKDAQGYGTSESPKSQLNTQISSRPSSSLPALQRQHYSTLPNSTGSTAKASGALGAPGASGSSRGAKPGGPGVFSRRDRPTWKQKPLPNGPPTLSSTSSDASSIPAGSTEATITSKHALNRSSPSLRHGRQGADRAASGKDGPQNQDVATTGPQRRPSDTSDKVLPASQIRETKRHHPYVEISSDDGSYVDEEDDEDTDDEDDDDEENATSFPTTRQGSARLRARSNGDSLLKGDHNDNLDGQRKTTVFSYDKTPSGKDYHEFSSESPS